VHVEVEDGRVLAQELELAVGLRLGPANQSRFMSIE
jgi:hypothetical protein